MKLPDDVGRLLARRFRNKQRDWLAEEHGAGAWPLEVPLGLPTEQAALRQVEGVRAWATEWQRWHGTGMLCWCERHWKTLGVQRLPDKLVLRDAAEVAAWVGDGPRWEQAVSRYQALTQHWPMLAGYLGKYFDFLADGGATDFRRLVEMLDWITGHPDSNLYPRQIPVAGVDSKWLESRTGLVSDLVAAIQGEPEGGRDFFRRCGLKPPPQLIRMRVLDPELRARLGGLGDVSAPWEDVARANLQPTRVFIVENLQTGLAFDDLPGAVVFMRLGYAVDVLGQIPWLHPARCFYWGDIDTHGFAILNRAKAYLPLLESVLMDESTLMRHRDLWVEETTPSAAAELPLLTDAERVLYMALKRNVWGQHVRLEQERLRWDVAWPMIRSLVC